MFALLRMLKPNKLGTKMNSASEGIAYSSPTAVSNGPCTCRLQWASHPNGTATTTASSIAGTANDRCVSNKPSARSIFWETQFTVCSRSRGRPRNPWRDG